MHFTRPIASPAASHLPPLFCTAELDVGKVLASVKSALAGPEFQSPKGPDCSPPAGPSIKAQASCPDLRNAAVRRSSDSVVLRPVRSQAVMKRQKVCLAGLPPGEGVTQASLERDRGHRGARAKPVGHGWESGWGAGGGGYKTVAPAVGVGRIRLEGNRRSLLGGADDQDATRRDGAIGPHAHGNAARHVVDDLDAEGSGQQNP